MSRFSEKQSYPIDIESFQKGAWTKYPWTRGHAILPDPLHQEMAAEALEKISETLGERANEISFFRLVTEDKALQFYMNGRDYEEIISQTGSGMSRVLFNFRQDLVNRSSRLFEAVQSGASSDALVSPNFPGEEGAQWVEVVPREAIEAMVRLSNEGGDFDSNNRVKTLLKKLQGRRGQKLTHRKLALVKHNHDLGDLNESMFPNFAEFFEYLRSHLTLSAAGGGGLRIPPTLLVGPPGIGKTEVLMKLAERVGTEFRVLNMASAQCGARLAGTDIHWGNCRHGELFDLLAFGQWANPIVFLDELDKVVEGRNGGDTMGSLYHLLERRSARSFEDLSLPSVTIDASQVIWFAAANDETTLDQAILSRFKPIHIPAPSSDQMPIVIRSIYKQMLIREPWGDQFEETLSDNVIDMFVDTAPRDIRVIMEQACARAIMDQRSSLIPSDINMRPKGRRIGF